MRTKLIQTESKNVQATITANDDGTLTVRFGRSFTLARASATDMRLLAEDLIAAAHEADEMGAE